MIKAQEDSAREIHPLVFLSGAKRFCLAADAVLDLNAWAPAPTQEPIFVLYHHAVELAFKSFLRFKNVPTQMLRSRAMGHRVIELHKLALEHNMSPSKDLSSHLESIVKLLQQGNENQAFRYGDGSGTIADPRWLQDVVTLLLSEVSAYVDPPVGPPPPGMIYVQVPHPELRPAITVTVIPKDIELPAISARCK